VSAPIPLSWLGLFAALAIFAVMLSLGLLLGREQIRAALERRVVLGAVLFAVVGPVPALAVLVVKLFGLKGVVAAGIVLMAISPGAPVALRRALEAGGPRQFAPALHLAVVALAVVTVPLSILILDVIFAAQFAVTPLQVGRQVFFAQFLPLGLGAAVRGWRPELAGRLEPRLARISNTLVLAFGIALLADMGVVIGAVGWVPTLAGAGLTGSALAVGAAFAGRDAPVRPAAAVAAAMRNPGLALLIARVNHAPPGVTAAVVGYALGLAVVMTAFLAWRRRVARVPARAPATGGPRCDPRSS
jgi:BASS family bile acid:Na+ symporter